MIDIIIVRKDDEEYSSIDFPTNNSEVNKVMIVLNNAFINSDWEDVKSRGGKIYFNMDGNTPPQPEVIY